MPHETRDGFDHRHGLLLDAFAAIVRSMVEEPLPAQNELARKQNDRRLLAINRSPLFKLSFPEADISGLNSEILE